MPEASRSSQFVSSARKHRSGASVCPRSSCRRRPTTSLGSVQSVTITSGSPQPSARSSLACARRKKAAGSRASRARSARRLGESCGSTAAQWSGRPPRPGPPPSKAPRPAGACPPAPRFLCKRRFSNPFPPFFLGSLAHFPRKCNGETPRGIDKTGKLSDNKNWNIVCRRSKWDTSSRACRRGAWARSWAFCPGRTAHPQRRTRRGRHRLSGAPLHRGAGPRLPPGRGNPGGGLRKGGVGGAGRRVCGRPAHHPRLQNHCIFCFIDQMPPNCRPTLYVKDDDWRMSLMMGNFVTLTNVDEEEMRRIVRRRASPCTSASTPPTPRCAAA